MFRRIYESLPGGLTARRLLMTLLLAVVAVVLVLLYEWLGATILDSGGAVG